MAASSTARQVIGAINGGVSPSGTEKYLAEQPVYTNKALIWSGVDKGGRIGGQAAAAIGQGAREESYLIKGIARAQSSCNEMAGPFRVYRGSSAGWARRADTRRDR
ncbi:MAG: hypothetical protein GX537_09635, partial [Actinobacteria bacterium]|nr:hypothetical protein [Actinomycetota bacterium]